ncbi:MAG: LapA family protein [Polaromonas sp.]|nr:LapA family protein [Polaromonas sp.]
MRYVYLVLILAITLLVVMFKVQNIDSVTVNFLTISLTLPLSLLIIAVYFLGMVTGSMLISLIRTWYLGAKAALPSGKN